jgi:hypothetical protein
MRKRVLSLSLVLAFVVGLPAVVGSSAPDTTGAARPASAETEPAKRFVQSTGTKDVAPTFSESGDVTNGVAGGYVFVPINPFRTLDSRNYVNGFMAGGTSMHFDVLTDENGVVQIPDAAVAVTYNLAIVDSVGSGFLAIYPADINWPGNASINWSTSGTTLSNGGTVAIGFLDAPGQVEVYAGPALPIGTDFVLDITGYYM